MCPPEHNLLLHTEQNLHKLAQSLLLPHFYFLDVQLWMAIAQWVKKGTIINCVAGSDLLCLILHAIFLPKCVTVYQLFKKAPRNTWVCRKLSPLSAIAAQRLDVKCTTLYLAFYYLHLALLFCFQAKFFFFFLPHNTLLLWMNASRLF